MYFWASLKSKHTKNSIFVFANTDRRSVDDLLYYFGTKLGKKTKLK